MKRRTSSANSSSVATRPPAPAGERRLAAGQKPGTPPRIGPSPASPTGQGSAGPGWLDPSSKRAPNHPPSHGLANPDADGTEPQSPFCIAFGSCFFGVFAKDAALLRFSRTPQTGSRKFASRFAPRTEPDFVYCPPMASPPSERGGSGAAENPIDRALACLINGDLEGALAWAGARVSAAPKDSVALLICSRLLGLKGKGDKASSGLRATVGLAIDGGNLPVAVAACRELKELGQDVDEHYGAVAAAFARGSHRLAPQQTIPPAMAAALVDPLPADSLDSAVDRAMQAAIEAADRGSSAGGYAPKIAPQLLFSSLDAGGLRAMIEVFDVIWVDTGSVLIEQATMGAEAFVVVRGELDVRRVKPDGSDLLLARLGAGALFGEMALLSRAPRAASVIASRPSIILVAKQVALDALAEKHPQVGHEFAAHCRGRMVSNLVRTSPIFAAIDQSERLSIMYRFVTRTFEAGERLIVQGEETDGLHLIASGEVDVIHREENSESLRLAELGVGEVVGEMGLVLRRPANADVLARVPTVTLHLPRDGFFDLVKEHPAVLGQLYALAVKRDEETSNIVAAEADSADGCLIL